MASTGKEAPEQSITELARARTPARSLLAEWFGIDPRSLALWRIGVSLVLLIDLGTRLQDFHAMYSDQGLLPLELAQAFWGETPRWSLFFLHPSDGWAMTLFVVGVACAIALLVGWRTTLAAIGCWGIMLSIHVRQPLVDSTGDWLLHLLLFWSMFTPMGRCWSLDARRNGLGDSRPVVSVGAACLLLQVCVMYWCAAYWKLNEVWATGEALQFAFRFHNLARPLAAVLLPYTGLLKLMTTSSLLLEAIGPLLLFSPWHPKMLRLLVALAFIVFHLTIEATLAIGWFSYLCALAWCLFLPDFVWQNRWWRLAVGAEVPRPAKETTDQLSVMQTGRMAASVFCGGCFAMVLIWNLGGMFRPIAVATPGSINIACYRLGLTQAWVMFSEPPVLSWWYVAEAELADGRVLDLLRRDPTDGEPVTLDLPSRLPSHYRRARWRQLGIELYTAPEPQRFQQRTAEFLAEEWNAAHPSGQQVVTLRMHQMELPSRPSHDTGQVSRIVATVDTGESAAAPLPSLLDLQDQGF
ncbi:HTTM domain-containing protein [Lignipirellula cremea]|uniref:Vitamin K-dependent gamma-carboxylase n=1 Tax=Lignipirellula cremea TaxID=2528010 RepID=A0A518DV87_9BACT|nr:HTTM domain-containing protein [Lignipirellula cremea]QDU95756.1 Vitamin K-dependent gamma-carboxylase [Lignipirellula cremea]